MSGQFSEKSQGRKSHGIVNNTLVDMKAKSATGWGPYWEWALTGSFFLSSKLGLLGLESISKQSIKHYYLPKTYREDNSLIL